jgi:heavy metal sensor kinase
MKLPLRARITAWYFAVLIVSFAAFAWISDYGFRRSIETTVNDASRANLESIENVLRRTAPQGPAEIKDELNELAGLWAGGALLEVADAEGKLIFQSPPFTHPHQNLPPADTREFTFFTTNLENLQYRIAMRSIEVGGQTFHVRAAVSTEPFDQALDRFQHILGETLPALVILASLTGYWLSGLALSPIKEIIRTVRGIGVQDLTGRLTVPEPQDELRSLSETLNDMLARIESSVKRLTQFTADASHDLRTPVALIRGSAELALRRSRTEEEYRETLSRILAASEETSHLIENLLTLARADAGAEDFLFERINLLALVQKAAEEADILAAAKGIQIAQEFPPEPLWASADERALQRVLLIVLENAVKYTPKGGHINIRLASEQGNAIIEVRDSGIGISEKDLPHIFERFYRADQARSREPGGSGLGLAIASWIVKKHGGTIEAHSTLGSGSVFRLLFPLAADTGHFK